MSELEAMRMREEVLQKLYWMRGEGLGEPPMLDVLPRFLAVREATLAPLLDRFIGESFIEAADGGYRLTPTGADLGKVTFKAEFEGLTKRGHGECDVDCWCHDSIEGAERCYAERAAGHARER